MAALATPEQYQALTGSPVGDVYQLDVASAVVRAYCGWQIDEVVDEQLVLDTRGDNVVSIPCMHVTDVLEVTVDSEPITDYTWSVVGTLHRDAGWPDGYRRVTVTYTGGYDPVPDEVTAVVCSAAQRAAQPAGVGQRTVGSRSVSYSPSSGQAALTQTEKAALSRHRLPIGA